MDKKETTVVFMDAEAPSDTHEIILAGSPDRVAVALGFLAETYRHKIEVNDSKKVVVKLGGVAHMGLGVQDIAERFEQSLVETS